MTWDDLTSAEQGRVLFMTQDQMATLRTDGVYDVIRFAADAIFDTINLRIGEYTSPEYLENMKATAYDEGHQDGHQCGWDEAMDKVEQDAKAKAVAS